jgi:hypothetical protein
MRLPDDHAGGDDDQNQKNSHSGTLPFTPA